MTEYSYFHNGTTKGDAIYAPYNAETFSSYLTQITGSGSGYCLPGYLNNLEVTAAAGKTVSVNTGGAVIGGAFYKNDAAVSVTLAANTAIYPRFDRIVVQLNRTLQTARIVVIAGTPSLYPAIPAINNNDNVTNLPLARVYLPASYAATSSSFVFDERQFLNNAYHINNFGMVNQYRNSENLAIDTFNTSLAGYLPQWSPRLSYSVERVFPTELWDGMRRGRVFQGWGYNHADYNASQALLTGVSSSIYTLWLKIKVQTEHLTLAFAGTSLDIYPTADPVDILIRVTTSGWQTVSITFPGVVTAPTYYQLGVMTLAHGYIPAPATPTEDEFNTEDHLYPISLTGLSTGTTTVTSAQFGSYVTGDYPIPYLPDGIKGLVVCMEVYDTGSAGAASCYAVLFSGGDNTWLRNDVRGAANSERRYVTGVVPLEDTSVYATLPYTLSVMVGTSGAGTMTVNIYPVGVIV